MGRSRTRDRYCFASHCHSSPVDCYSMTTGCCFEMASTGGGYLSHSAGGCELKGCTSSDRLLQLGARPEIHPFHPCTQLHDGFQMAALAGVAAQKKALGRVHNIEASFRTRSHLRRSSMK